MRKIDVCQMNKVIRIQLNFVRVPEEERSRSIAIFLSAVYTICTVLHQVNGSETNRMLTFAVERNNMLFYTENIIRKKGIRGRSSARSAERSPHQDNTCINRENTFLS